MASFDISMTKDLYVFLALWLLLNFITFMMMCIDKQERRRHRHSSGIKTYLYFTLAMLGGSFGELLGMLVFRHKLHHKEYVIFMPIIFIIQVVIVYCVLRMYFSTTVDPFDLVPA